jgi:hypothetical protein
MLIRSVVIKVDEKVIRPRSYHRTLSSAFREIDYIQDQMFHPGIERYYEIEIKITFQNGFIGDTAFLFKTNSHNSVGNFLENIMWNVRREAISHFENHFQFTQGIYEPYVPYVKGNFRARRDEYYLSMSHSLGEFYSHLESYRFAIEEKKSHSKKRKKVQVKPKTNIAV